MSIARHFPRDYADARARFLEAARDAGATVTSYQNPLRGPGGERLFTDVGWWGPADAERVFMTISATHGVEGFCGALCQIAWFAEGLVRELPRGIALAAVHAINPHGFAWLRRVTEDNVDLNRNFVDHTKPYPVNAGYEALADAIAPAEWTPASRAAAQAKLDAYAARHGAKALQAAISSGQYSHPLGIFFGGHAPTWSHRTLLAILDRFCARARHVAVLDFHTGLGPYGYGEIIGALPAKSEGFRRIQEWLSGEATSPDLGDSSSAPLYGINQPGMAARVPHAAFSGIALEYGVRPLDETLNALRADNWLHAHGDLDSAQAREIKAEMRRVFYGDTDAWKAMVWERAVDVTRRMLKGLADT
ncbi:MAG TPA: M14 family metallopeptidase [Alphaproteobacteria bacterium]